LPLIKYLSQDKGFQELSDMLYLQGAATELIYFLNDLNNYEPPDPRYRFAIQQKNIFTYLFVNKAENIERFVKNEEHELRKTKLVSIPIEKSLIICEDKIIIGETNKKNFSILMITDYPLASLLAAIIKNSL
jgi:hypothetical protein